MKQKAKQKTKKKVGKKLGKVGRDLASNSFSGYEKLMKYHFLASNVSLSKYQEERRKKEEKRRTNYSCNKR